MTGYSLEEQIEAVQNAIKLAQQRCEPLLATMLEAALATLQRVQRQGME